MTVDLAEVDMSLFSRSVPTRKFLVVTRTIASALRTSGFEFILEWLNGLLTGDGPKDVRSEIERFPPVRAAGHSRIASTLAAASVGGIHDELVTPCRAAAWVDCSRGAQARHNIERLVEQ
jgi:hypothetical protein